MPSWFGWDWFNSNTAYTVLATLFVRLWIWIWDKEFTGRREVAFWVAVPAFVFLTLTRVQGSDPTPKLKLDIERIEVSATAGCDDPELKKLGEGQDFVVLVTAAVRNAGVPSMADCCDLRITAAGAGTSVDAKRIMLPDKLVLADRDGTKTAYYSTDALYDKLVSRTLGQNELIRGIILFGTSRIAGETLMRVGTEYRLSLVDVTGTPVTTTFVWPLNPTPNRGYLPGMRFPGVPATP
jgi:hypothetical protein